MQSGIVQETGRQVERACLITAPLHVRHGVCNGLGLLDNLVTDRRTPMRFLYTFCTLLALSGATVLSATAQQPGTLPMRSVSVSGEATVRVVPDQAVVRFGVVTQASEPEAARSQNAAASRDVLNSVRALGIQEGRIRMETLRLQPARDYNPETQRYEERGFEAVREVVVEVDDLEVVPTLVAEVIAQGANRLNGVTYDLQDRSAARNEAMREALLNAREKADLLARTVDEELGEILVISEQAFDFPRPMLDFARAEMAKGSPEPEAYAPGEIEVRATIQAVFRLAD